MTWEVVEVQYLKQIFMSPNSLTTGENISKDYAFMTILGAI